eukprot:603678-Hanusia_phi.AAC.1
MPGPMKNEKSSESRRPRPRRRRPGSHTGRPGARCHPPVTGPESQVRSLRTPADARLTKLGQSLAGPITENTRRCIA